jgi:class 3 adenylate cyclase
MDRVAVTGIKAILFTDQVGSSKLRSRLGDAPADLLSRHHDDLLGHVTTRHRGTVLRWTGDGMEAEFPTASAAVSAAIEEPSQRRSTGPETSPSAPVRVGSWARASWTT